VVVEPMGVASASSTPVLLLLGAAVERQASSHHTADWLEPLVLEWAFEYTQLPLRLHQLLTPLAWAFALMAFEAAPHTADFACAAAPLLSLFSQAKLQLTPDLPGRTQLAAHPLYAQCQPRHAPRLNLHGCQSALARPGMLDRRKAPRVVPSHTVRH
jgi:hypothetical protein